MCPINREHCEGCRFLKELCDWPYPVGASYEENKAITENSPALIHDKKREIVRVTLMDEKFGDDIYNSLKEIVQTRPMTDKEQLKLEENPVVV